MTTEPSSAEWRKSTYSGNGGNCVEIAFFDGGQVGVRDSKNPTGPALKFTPSEWSAFLSGVRDRQFDRP
ncbi:DUF397 domain-containing protein [Nocardia sp. NBC_01730]|uniref:DUF397 domain-containing protein n=1 Tax=Nocardia sp. NBC_01730 TaxID=2975998 RepID=UPI002E134482|nr:DUF397 domain-containing protein [Nocardia sp. NBC_01730]